MIKDSSSSIETDSSVTVTLLMDLSRPISIPTELFEMLQKALVVQFGEEFHSSLKAIILQNPRQALAFFKNSNLLNQIIAENTISLGRSHSVSFTYAPDLSTEYLDVEFPLGPQHLSVRDLQGLATETHGFQSCLMFYRKSSMLVKLQSVAFAKNIESNLGNIPGAGSAQLITLGDHCCLDCWWISQISLAEALIRLKRTGETLYGVMQGMFSLLSEQPCLLDVSIPPTDASTASKESPDLILICCTIKDAEIIRSCASFKISSIGKFVFTFNEFDHERKSVSGDSRESFTTDEDLNLSENGALHNEFESHDHSDLTDCFIFWDVDTCPVPGEVSRLKLKQIIENIESILRMDDLQLSREGNFMFLTESSSQVSFSLIILIYLLSRFIILLGVNWSLFRQRSSGQLNELPL